MTIGAPQSGERRSCRPCHLGHVLWRPRPHSRVLDASPQPPPAGTGGSGARHAGFDAPRLLERYRRLAVASDAVAAGTAALLALVVRFALEPPRTYVAVTWPFRPRGSPWSPCSVATRRASLAPAPRSIRRTTIAAMALFIAVAVTSFAMRQRRVEGLRAGRRRAALLVLSLVGRHLLRGWVYRLRRAGQGVQRVLVVGRADAAVAVIDKFRQEPQHGLLAVAACVPQASVQVSHIHDVPVVGDSDRIIEAVDDDRRPRRRRGLAPGPRRPVAAPVVLGAGGARRRTGRLAGHRRGRRSAAVDPPGRGPAAAAPGAADLSAAAGCSQDGVRPRPRRRAAARWRPAHRRHRAWPSGSPAAARRCSGRSASAGRPPVHDAQVPLDGGRTPREGPRWPP